MSKLLKGLNDATNYTYTENGAVARATTNSLVLDFFAQGGALRGAGASRAVPLFAKAWSEDALLALKVAFYMRDVRGGQGQREAFRAQLAYLSTLSPDTVRANLKLIPEYGRWDDLYAIVEEPDAPEWLVQSVFQLFSEQLKTDLTNKALGKPVSILAKWLKSINTSSAKSRRLAHETRKALWLNERQYRTMLSTLRKYIDVTECNMSAKQWHKINYSAVPAKAALLYRNAFKQQDEHRYVKWLEDVKTGKAKINAGTLYPYEIVAKILYNLDAVEKENDNTLEELWKALPDYVAGNKENSIAVVDTSGSMTTRLSGGKARALDVAVSLGLYLAERARGPFKDHFITFSKSPKLERISGNTLAEKVEGMARSSWGFNTNIESVFNLILDTAIKYKIPQEEMLDKVYIISDMEFDDADQGQNPFGLSDQREWQWRKESTLFNAIKEKYELHGYKLPLLVFWNVDARNAQFPMSMDDRGFQSVSGFSPSIFEALMGNEMLDAYAMMLKVINSERYSSIQVVD